ncbi:hypothetical protein EYF80_006090 [Liparis tanakae]|uniref:Uncharacterized protein n=1 Tax=Liparis tanakae TaxID=230148 RepID=A0A4Z2J263_9TELE|nr:hypothetical protein EYF80_006090 [Liparis tanakae]
MVVSYRCSVDDLEASRVELKRVRELRQSSVSCSPANVNGAKDRCPVAPLARHAPRVPAAHVCIAFSTDTMPPADRLKAFSNRAAQREAERHPSSRRRNVMEEEEEEEEEKKEEGIHKALVDKA